jgi:hypothetical protein
MDRKLGITVTYIDQQTRLVEALGVLRGTLWPVTVTALLASVPPCSYYTPPPLPQNSQFHTIQADLPCPADRETAFRFLRSFVSLSLHCSYLANFPQVLLRRAIKPSV